MDSQIKVHIEPFLDKENKLTKIPRKREKLVCALIYIADKFDSSKVYSEKEVNDILAMWHTFNDHASLRRALCDMGFLMRDKSGSEYSLNATKLRLEDFELWISGKH